jgi:hypothetical protein
MSWSIYGCLQISSDFQSDGLAIGLSLPASTGRNWTRRETPLAREAQFHHSNCHGRFPPETPDSRRSMRMHEGLQEPCWASMKKEPEDFAPDTRADTAPMRSDVQCSMMTSVLGIARGKTSRPRSRLCRGTFLTTSSSSRWVAYLRIMREQGDSDCHILLHLRVRPRIGEVVPTE